MPLPNPIPEPSEELESLIPALAPHAPSILPGTAASKSLYQTGVGGNPDPLSLTTTGKQPPLEFGAPATDDFIINKTAASGVSAAGIPVASTDSDTADPTAAPVDPLTGGSAVPEGKTADPPPSSSAAPDGKTADPLTNPGTAVGSEVAQTAGATGGAPEGKVTAPGATDPLNDGAAVSGASNNKVTASNAPDVLNNNAAVAGASNNKVTAPGATDPLNDGAAVSGASNNKATAADPSNKAAATDASNNKATAADASNKATATDTSTGNPASQTTVQSSATNAVPVEFSGGTFKVKEVPGQDSFVGIEFIADGGLYRGELAVFSLEGMDKFAPGSPEFIKEAARRALSNSHEGYVVISDATEGALLPSYLPEGDFNSGEYKGVKTFAMKPGSQFGFMLVPNGTVRFVLDNPSFGGDKQPLFSMVTANPDDAFRLGQIADVTGDGSTFVIEDLGVVEGADGDYNDVIFRVTGAVSNNIPGIGSAIKPGKDWRDTAWGKNLMSVAAKEPQPPGATAANSDAPAEEKTPAVGNKESSPTPPASPTVSGTNSKESVAIETTVKSELPQSENKAIAPTDKEPPTTETNAAGAVVSGAPQTGTNATEVIGSATEKTETNTVETAGSATQKTGTNTVETAGNPTPQTPKTATEAVEVPPPQTGTAVAGTVEPEGSTAPSIATDAVASRTPQTSPSTDGTAGTTASKPETTVAGAANSETSKIEVTVAVTASSETSKPEVAVAGTAGSETLKAEVTVVGTAGSETPKTEIAVTDTATPETLKAEVTVTDAAGSETPSSEVVATGVPDSESSSSAKTVPDAVDRPTLKTETTVTDAPNYPTASASIIVTDVAAEKPFKPETTVIGVGTPEATETGNLGAASPSGELPIESAEISNSLTEATATDEPAAAPAATDADTALAGTDTEPAAISNSLPGITDTESAAISSSLPGITDTETATITNILSGEITDPSSPTIPKSLSGEITDTDSPTIPNSLSGEITDTDSPTILNSLSGEITDTNSPAGPIESATEIDAIPNSLPAAADSEIDAIPEKSGEVTDTETAAIGNSLPGITDTEPPAIGNGLSGITDTEPPAIGNGLSSKITDTDTDPNSAIATNGEPPADTFALSDSDNSDSEPSFANLSIASASIPAAPGTFTVGQSGTVRFDYTFDGGYYEGELAIFSLTGMESLVPGSPEFIAEAARRVLTNSTEGHVVIRDSIEGARFTGAMPGEGEWGSGPYRGIKTFNMTPGDTFAVMLVPTGTVQSSLEFSWLWDLFPEMRPLFSLPSANPNNSSYVLPIADATGTGNTFALEDTAAATSDGDFNDVIFTVLGATGNAPPIGQLIDPNKEWRTTPLGQQIIEYANDLVSPTEPDENTIWLSEGTVFANTFLRDLSVPTVASTLDIGIAGLSFDISDTDPKSINDALEISLVDKATGKPLTGTIAAGKNALFNITEGLTPQLAGGVTFTGSRISIDLSQIAPGTTATLQVRLVNNDGDTATRVGITSVAVRPGAAPPPIPTAPPAIVPDTSPIDFAALKDVSGSVETQYGRTSFNSTTNVLHADLALKNTGLKPLRDRLLVGVTNISDPTVKLLDAAGITPDGIVYYDFTPLVGDGLLAAGETTLPGTLKFHNPSGIQFSYDLVFLSELNQPPQFSGTPDAEVVIGKPYVYKATATDPEGDAIAYSLLEKPAGMEIDSQTGSITWNPTTADLIGNYKVTVKADDGNGGITELTYTLSAVSQPPNRPPIFTSTPVVDAWIDKPYRYDSEAADPDSDPVGYSLIRGPEGMRVNPNTGLVEWTPPAVLVLGDTVLGKISLPGETDEFTFSGTSGQRIYIDPLQYSGAPGDWKFEIISPSGKSVSDGNLSSNRILNLTETGNYRIVTSTNGDATGSYGFSVIDLGLVPAVPFDTTVKGTLSPGSEDDLFRFTGSKGQKLFFDNKTNAGGFDWVLYSADNKTVPSSIPGPDLELKLPSDGEYVLALRGNSSFTSTVDYSFEIITPDDITIPIVPGRNAAPNSIYGELKEKGETDYYTFTGEVGQRIYFDRLFYKQDDTNYLRPHRAKLISPSNSEEALRQLEYNDDGNPITLKESGTYRIEIDATEENTGTYSFSVLDLALAAPLNLDTDTSGTLNPGQETHLYQFTGSKNQRLFFDTPGGTANANWTLYDSGNNVVPDGNAYQYNDMEVVLPNSGTYTLAIRGNNNNTPVDYSFKVITPDVQPGTLVLNVPVSGDIGEKGEQDVYTFSGTKGQRVFLDTLMETPRNKATLVSPSGTKVITSSPLESDSSWRSPVILPEDGIYSLTVDGDNQTTDPYSFRLVDASNVPILQKDALSPTSGALTPKAIQFYQFTGAKGDRIYFDSQQQVPNTYWHLYDSNNNELVNEISLSSNGDFEYPLKGDGTYYLMLRTENSTPVNYQIQLVTTPTNPPPAPIAPNSLVSNSISKLGEQDVYTFTGSVGQTLYFDPRTGDSDITVKIQSPSGKVFLNGSNTNADEEPFTLTEPGTYKLTVDGNYGKTGGYSFILSDAASLPLLPLGSPLSGSLAAKETVLYKINGTAGQQLEFDSLSGGSGAEWVLYAPQSLLNPDNYFTYFELNRVGRASLDSSTANSDFARVLPADGTYILALRNPTANPVSYNVQANSTLPPATTNSGLSVMYNSTLSAPNEVDESSFTVAPGTLIYFDGQSNAPGRWVRLLKPNSTNDFVFNLDSSSDGGAYQLTQTGPYKLQVYGSPATATGSYSFQLVDLKASPTLVPSNAPINVSLNPREIKAYKFTGTAGQKIWFDGLNTTNPNITAKLLNSSGREITSTTNLQGDIQLQTLEAGGEYYLVLQSNNTSPTVASFRLLDSTGATPLTSLDNRTVSGNFGASQRETALYKFQGLEGQRLYFDRTDGYLYNYYKLYSPDGNQILFQYLNSDDEVAKLPSSGEYLLAFVGENYTNNNYGVRIVTPTDAASSLTLGTPVVGEITKAGQQNTYTFPAQEGQRLWFDSLQTASNITGTLYSPTGAVIWNNQSLGSDRELADLTTLKETGNYRFVADGSGDATGSYNFRILDLAAAAQTTSLDTNITGNFGTSKREARVYKFTGTEGQYVYFDRTDGGGSYYSVYSPDGQRFVYQDLSYDDPYFAGYADNGSEPKKLPSSGEYTLVFNGTGQINNNYALQMVTPDLVTQTRAIGDTIAGTISEPGEQDTYTFTGSPGQQLWLDTLLPNGSITAYLYSPKGGSPIGTYNLGDDSNGSNLLTLTEAGTYTLKVDGSYDYTGAYQFRFLDSTAATVTSLDTPIAGNFGTSKREAIAYRFNGTQGQPLYFDRLDGSSSNYYHVYRPDGTLLFSQNLASDYEPTSPVTEPIKLPFSGEYTVIFSGKNASDNNNYNLKIVTPDIVTAPYNVGDTVSGTIGEPGEQDTYAFTGTIGQKLWFDSLENSPANLTLKLVDPDGKTIFGEWYNGYQSANSDREPVVLEKQGNYKLIVDSSGDRAGDTYSFRLLDLAAGETLTLDAPISGNFGTSKREAKTYKFQGAEGSYLYFDMTAGDPSNSYYLLDPYGKKSIDNRGLTSDGELALPVTGEYSLVLVGKDRPNNNYEFKVVRSEQNTVPLTLGQTVSQSIGKAGEKDTYTFEGKLGQKLFFDGLTGNANLPAQLYDPFGNLVASTSGVSSVNTNADWLSQPLTASGTYRLVVDGSDNNTGNYSFRLSDLASATPLNLTAPTTGTAATGEANLYQITGRQGQVLNFDLSAATWSNGGNWVLYGPDSKAIASPPWNSPDFKVALPVAGLYALAVTGNNTLPVSYTFNATDSTPAPQTNTGLNSVISGSLAAGGTAPPYRFTASAGTQIFFDSINNGSITNNGQIRARLIAPDNTTRVFDNQDTNANSQPLTLPQTGEYTVQIYGASPSSSGSYQFRIAELPNSLRNPAVNYLATGIVESVTTNGTQAKVYTFEGVQGLRVAFNGMTGSNVSATLYDPTGKAVFTGFNFQNTEPITLAQNGLYQLVIEGQLPTNQSYSFQLLELSSASSMPFNVPVSGTLASGTESKLYKFQGTKGERLFFDSLQGNTSNLWKLYGPDNKQVPGGNNWLGNALEVELPATGEYALLIEGSTSIAPVNYQFRAFRYEKTAADIVTPGTGETGSNAGGSLGLYPVKLEASDGQGGKDVQEYNIRVWPDPTNANPVIVSEPVQRFGLDDKIYRYQVAAVDPDGDRLKYRLVEAPLGALIDGDTGELLWFPENVAPGSRHDFTVEVADPRGGKGLQKFKVDALGAVGKIQGAVFDDLNGNGFRDSKLVKGDNPAIIVAIDTSGSTAAPFAGPTGVDTVLKAQVAATLTLIDTLIAQGLGDRVNIGLIPHQNSALIQDMDPATPGVQYYTTPNADRNNNGISDIREILASTTYTTPNGHNDFTHAVEAIDQLVPLMPGDKNVIFMSDGYGALDPAVAASVRTDLQNQGIGLTAFGIGKYSTLDTLKKIDPDAVILSDIDQLSGVFGGFDPRYTLEPLKENVPVYLDLNNNGTLDPNEPKQLTAQNNSEGLGATNYQFAFDNLEPGTYRVRVVPPSGYAQTAPAAPNFADTVTAAGQTFTRLFGVHKAESPPNSDPTFLTLAPPYRLSAGESLVYRALASDPNADELTYSLVLSPPGMSVDPKNGTVVWTPTAAQVEEYYKELRATRDRLIAFGRPEAAPTVVKFNVALRATDGKGGQALQYVEVELVPPNTPPVFTSTVPDNLLAQTGKRFEYRATAADADGDTVTYTLQAGFPAGVTVNPTTGLVTWTPTTATPLGATSFTVLATDGRSAPVKQEVSLRAVEPIPNRPPDITSTPRTEARTGSSYFYQLAATDPDGNPLSFTLVSSPPGMTLTNGAIAWTPTAAQTGPQAVSVSVSDGQGGTDTQSWNVTVSNSTANRPPAITSVPDAVTNLEKVYRYQPAANDPDGDPIFWSLDSAPKGMVIDPKTGSLSWQPTAGQVGEHTVAVRATDALGSYTGQEFTLKVTGINTPPAIVSMPVTVAGANQTYRYQVLATDPENDALRYSLGTKPEGMRIDGRTGAIEWTPDANAVGTYEVEVLATDAQGGVGNQKFAVRVGTAAINQPPAVVSTPVFAASLGSQYSYQVRATDPDGGSLTYQLLQAPAGVTINPTTGLLTWDNPTAGNHQIAVGAVDAGGLGAAQGFTLTARANSAPVIPAVPAQQSVAGGATYRYDLRARDAEGDLLTYTLVQAPTGMKVDEFGRVSWTPAASDIGTTKPVQIAITDTFGKTVNVAYNLSVVADTIAPKVNLIASKNPANLGDSVTFTVNAVDNVKVESLGLTINGTPIAIDAQGKATVNNLTTNLNAVATAKDAAGNPGTATLVVNANDPNDVGAPTLTINLQDDAEVTAPVNIIGTISDTNLDYYTLEIAPVGSNNLKEVYRGTANVTNGTVATFDPTVLANGAYVLKFTAFDTNGNGSTTERTVNVAGDLKLGNFRLSFNDLTVPVAGIPISITRTYDSLNANNSDDFGYGWRMEFRDTDLKTSLKPDPTYEELGVNTVPFDSKTKVFITLPGGKRETFTFKPKPHHLNGYLGAIQGAAMYKPAFESQKGSTMTLTVKDANLVRTENGGYYGVNGQPFNPENPAFGGIYILTTQEGLVYEIDAKTGDLLTATDSNGNKLTFSDAGIASSTGKSVTFERDAAGKIVSVVDPDGKKVKYEYDAKGDLVAVSDRETNRTQFKYEDADRPHFLTEVIDPLGRSGVKTEYDDSGRLKQMVDVNGEKVELIYDPNNSVQKVKDVFGKETTYEYDARGNVVTETDPFGKRIVRTYDTDNNLLTETDGDGVTTKFTYDDRRNLLTIEDEDGNITRMTYDNRGRATSIVSPTGLKTAAKYDSRGNLIESTDTDGLKTTYTYNARGQLLTQTAPDGQVNSFEYDAAGNIKRTIDSRGNQVDFDYNPNGRIEFATTAFTLNGQTHTLRMEYDYDSEGRIIASRTSQGNNQSIIYDALGRVKSVTDAFGNVTSYRYDLPLAPGENTTPIAGVGRAVTRIDEVTLPDNTPTNTADNPKVINKYDAANNLIAQISPTGLETRHVYDNLNRRTETILPDRTPLDWTDNPRTKTEYSDGGRIKSHTDILGNKTQYFYNDLGQIVRVLNPFLQPTTYTYTDGGQVETVTDYRNRKTQFVYDDKARVKEVIFFDNSRIKIAYDELGRVKTETNELNQTTTYEYDAKSRVKAVINANRERTEFEYDHRDNLVRVTDPLLQSTAFKYDEYGQQVGVTFHNGDKVAMGYDRFGRLTAYTDENFNPTKYTYDNLSQLIQIEQPKQVVNGQLQDTFTKYTYDNLSRLQKIEDANTKVTEFKYDEFNRPWQTILPLGQSNRTDYNKFGQVTATTDFNGDKIDYSYDPFGRLDGKNFTDPGIPDVSYTYDPVTLGLATVTDGRGITRYGYDNYDRLQTVTTPDQKVVQYGYDLLDNITSLVTPTGTTTYGYDVLNRLDTVSKGNRVLADYDYNPAGNLSKITLGDSSVEERKYDTRNRLERVTAKNSTGTTFNDFKYTLDGVGNRKKVEEFDGRTVDYTYDALNRLTQEKMTGGVTGNRTVDYTYDLVGNRLTRDDSTAGLANYSYDANNRLRQLTQGSQTTAFNYDDNGSIIQRTDGTQTVTYDWFNDGENRLAGVTNSGPGGTSQTNFVYDAFGNRVASIDINNNVRTNYLTASIGGLPEVLMEYDANDLVTADYTHGLGLVSAVRNNREGFYHTDGIGSTRAITDSTGLITDRYTYDAFGGLLNQTGTFGNSFQFAGEQRDGSTGLDYMRARYYDPSLGRFISKDAFSGFLSDPYSQHDYQYAHANPVRFTDPTGYFSVQELMGTVAVAGQLAAIGGTAGGIGAGLGYIGGAAIGGASGEEILGMFGDWGAGFANGVSGGFLTDTYALHSGSKFEPTHGALWSAGTVTGIGVSFLLGMKLPLLVATSVGPLQWAAAAGMVADTAFDVYGAAQATGNLYNSYQDNGAWEIQDSWNLLSYLPFVGMIKGVKQGLGAARKATKGSTPGADDLLKKGLESTDTEVAGASKGDQHYVPDLSHVTGKTARARNKTLESIIKEDFPHLQLTHAPKYSPFIRKGIGKQNRGTQIGKDNFSSRKDLRNVIIHEELHHRWWERGIPARDHHSKEYVPDEKFYEVIRRYERMRGWKK